MQYLRYAPAKGVSIVFSEGQNQVMNKNSSGCASGILRIRWIICRIPIRTILIGCHYQLEKVSERSSILGDRGKAHAEFL
jgi:hypothetical protein